MKLKSITSKILLLTLTLFCVNIIACSKSNITDNANSPKANSINIKYVGNSCFYITLSDGTRIVTDPYGKNYASYFAPFPSLEADVITISHNHTDHTGGIKEVGGNPKIVRLDDLNEPMKIGSAEITGYPTKHIANMGDNTVFVIKEGNFKIVNIGETDTIDSETTLEAIKNADVVLAYAGEYGTVKNNDIFNFLNQINAKVVIPEHYSMNPDLLFYEQPTIDKILTELPEGTKVNKLDELVVKEGLEKQFVVLSPMGSKK